MILRDKDAYKPLQSGRYIPYWGRMLNSLTRQLDLSKNRYLLSEQYATPSVVFIRTIMDTFDPVRMDDEDLFDLYHNYLIPESIMVGKKFYPLVNSPRINRFVKKPVHEITLPTHGIVDNVNFSPLDGWDRWIDAKPFRLVAHDSLELRFPEDHLFFRYKTDQPSYMVFCMDIPALMMKFLTYVRDRGERLDEVDRDKFIQNHVLANIYNDMLDCWLLNFLEASFDDTEVMTDRLLDLAKANQYIGISSLNLAHSEMQDLFDRAKRDKIRLSALLSTEYFVNGSLADIMDLHEDRMIVGTDNRTIGFELIKSSVLLNIMVNIIELQPAKTTQIRRSFALEYGIMRRSNWKSHILNRELKEIGDLVMANLSLAL